MTERCADLDEFFDGELPADQADAFRDHLASCDRCERVLHGRMQESVAARVPAARFEQAAAPAVAQVEVPPHGGSGTATSAVGRAAAAGKPHRTGSFRRAVAYAAPLLAAAAAVPLWLGHGSESEFLALAIDRAPVTDRGTGAAVPRRGLSAHTHDVLRPKVQGERHQAIWVYLDERELILRCPEDATCRSADGELAVELELTARGHYAIVAVGSSDPLPAPGATLDRTLAAARTAGVRTQVKYVVVD